MTIFPRDENNRRLSLKNSVEVKHGTDVPIVTFVGSSLSFPDRFIELAGQEFSDFNFLRAANCTQLRHIEGLGARIHLVIYEETHIPQVIERTADFFSGDGNERLAFTYNDPEMALQLIEAAASDPRLARSSLIPLNAQLEVTLSIIKLLLCGQQYLPCCFWLQEMAEAPKKPDPPPGATGETVNLTSREWQVLALVAEGRPNKLVAHKLEMSEHTVKLHMHHILGKLQLRNRTEASAWYFANCNRGSSDLSR